MIRQLTSVLLLPFNAIIAVPVLLYFLCGKKSRSQFVPAPISAVTRVVGVLLIIIGCPLLIFTIRDFARLGNGTLAPWDPTQKLVVSGVYLYVRNPMISGVISILFGLALLLNTVCHFGWAVLFAIANAVYMPLSEEPGLEKRFGEDYEIYKQNVPRWIPRLKPWSPSF